MPKNQDSLNQELFSLLQSRGYNPTLLDTSGKEIPVPEEAEVFQFNFEKDDKDYGTATISIDGLHKLVIYFNENIANSPKTGQDDSESWYSLLKQFKRFAQKHQLSFELKNIDRLKYDMAKRDYTKKLDEGYHAMGKKASYNDSVPTTKMIIKHKRNMEEGEQRFRQIDKIFIENSLGERILAPTNKPGIGRAFARHIAEGGRPYDERWNHITKLCEDYGKMAGFVRATRNNQFNESAQKLVSEGVNHYLTLRETLHRLSGKKGYSQYFENWSPVLSEDDVDGDLGSMFTNSSLDPRIESVLPILSSLKNNITDSPVIAEVSELEEWADKVIEGRSDERDDYDPEQHNIKETEKIADRYDPEDFDAMVKRVGEKAKKNPVDISDLARRLHAAMKKSKEKEETKTDEGVSGAIAGGTIGAALTKSPSGAMTGASIGSDVQDMFTKETTESGPAGKPGDYFDTEKVSTGSILGNKPQTQRGLRGKLVGENQDLQRIKRLSGL